jgi:serine/threonine protein kinase
LVAIFFALTGGFAYVYLVRDLTDNLSGTTHSGGDDKTGSTGNGSSGKRSSRTGSTSKAGDEGEKRDLVLKITSILSRQQREIAEKEAKLLSRLSHPSIVKMFDTCYRTIPLTSSTFRKSQTDESKNKERTQHMILMEYCEGGHAMGVCTQLIQKGERFDLSTLIIAFGQICNAVSYLHAQRPPIVHRDLKPENFLIKGGAYKLCDFGSAVFGHVDLKTTEARREAEEVIEKTTTQMYRAPEMVDLYVAKKLTQATDVWALGCCLYSLAFLKNCFEEGSNLAILSRNYKIPDDSPYGDGLAELIDRMLTDDSKARADMTEVILCLSAVYSQRPLPPRKERKSKDKKDKDSGEKEKRDKEKKKKTGTFRTDGQGIQNDLTLDPSDPKRVKEAKKLDPNSAAARRRQAAGGDNLEFATFHSRFDKVKSQGEAGAVNQELAFSTTQNPFASFDGKDGGSSGPGLFDSFNDDNCEMSNAFNSSADWDAAGGFNSLSLERGRAERSGDEGKDKKMRSRSQDHRRRRKDKDIKRDETPEETIDRLAAEDDDDDDDASVAESVATKGGTVTKKVVARRGVRRMVSSQPRPTRSLSRGTGLRRTKSGSFSNRSSGSRKRGDSDDGDSSDEDTESD